MTYSMEVLPSCRKDIIKACRRNPVIQNVLRNKMAEIITEPLRFKPLQHGLAGERRVHILKSFVLKYRVDISSKLVIFIFFGHHDDAYRR